MSTLSSAFSCVADRKTLPPPTHQHISYAERTAHTQSKDDGAKGKKDNILGHDPVAVPLSRIKRLPPPARAETPLAASLQADGAEVVAARGGELKELVCHFGCFERVVRMRGWMSLGIVGNVFPVGDETVVKGEE